MTEPGDGTSYFLSCVAAAAVLCLLWIPGLLLCRRVGDYVGSRDYSHWMALPYSAGYTILFYASVRYVTERIIVFPELGQTTLADLVWFFPFGLVLVTALLLLPCGFIALQLSIRYHAAHWVSPRSSEEGSTFRSRT
jgi:hypothetical protein